MSFALYVAALQISVSAVWMHIQKFGSCTITSHSLSCTPCKNSPFCITLPYSLPNAVSFLQLSFIRKTNEHFLGNFTAIKCCFPVFHCDPPPSPQVSFFLLLLFFLSAFTPCFKGWTLLNSSKFVRVQAEYVCRVQSHCSFHPCVC